MKVRRTISLDKVDLDILKPILDSNGNNLSQALRQVIDEHRQKVNMNCISGDQQRLIMLRNQIIEARIASLVPVPLIKWLLKNNRGVPPLGTFRIMMEKYAKLFGIENLTLKDYMNIINAQHDIFGYQIRQHIEINPETGNIRISFEGEDPYHLKGTVVNYSSMLAHNPIKLKTKKIVESPGLIIVDFEQCENEEEAYRSVLEHFGHDQIILDEILNYIKFWRIAVNIMKAGNYDDVILGRDVLLDIMNSRDFSKHLCDLILSIYGVPVEDAGEKNIAGFIEEICKTCGLISKLEHNEHEIRIFHQFDDNGIINSINETIINTLERAGQHFELKKNGKMTVLNQGMPSKSKSALS